jgi:TonB family protein
VATNTPPGPPPSAAQRTKNFLLYGFALSILLHLLLGPFVKFQHTQTEEDAPQKVTVAKIPTPPPTPPPTPTPKPTPPPTPPPKETPPPKQTPAPQQPKLKINTLKTTNTHSGESEAANTHTTGNTQGIPQGIGTGPPSSAPPATPAPAPPPTPTPRACARPNVPPSTVRAVEPDMPAMAQQQGITGDVTVDVSLDEANHIVSATVESSPSKILNSAALSAARQSTFQTEIRDCKPIAATYRFVVTFASQ